LVLLREMGAGQAQGYYFAKPMGLEMLLATALAGR
jgi:EAL domain-containing protein (putative c-di-GMP-specific phosphodiesterase class I)